MSAEGVAHVPVEQLASFGVDGCVACDKIHCSALSESKAFVFTRLDDIVALLCQRVLGSDINGEVRSTLVHGVLCFVAKGVFLYGLVQAEEDHLGDELLGVVGFDHLGLRSGVGVFTDNGLDVFELDVGELGLVLGQWLQVVAEEEGSRRVLESSREEDIVAAEEAKAVERRACDLALISITAVFVELRRKEEGDVITGKVVGDFLAKLPRQH